MIHAFDKNIILLNTLTVTPPQFYVRFTNLFKLFKVQVKCDNNDM